MMNRYGVGFRLDGPPEARHTNYRDKPDRDAAAHRFKLIMKIPCPTCNARPGRPCWFTPHGPKLHPARFQAAGQ